MPDRLTNLETIQHYLKCIENGNFPPVVELFAPDAVIEQLPNRIYPNGIRSGLPKMAEAFDKGRKLLVSQTYELKHHLVNGDYVAVEVLWTGKLAVSFGTLAAGSEMRAHSAMFFEFKEGKIISQRNYDCFEPW